MSALSVKFAENSEFWGKKFTIIQKYSLHSLETTRAPRAGARPPRAAARPRARRWPGGAPPRAPRSGARALALAKLAASGAQRPSRAPKVGSNSELKAGFLANYLSVWICIPGAIPPRG